MGVWSVGKWGKRFGHHLQSWHKIGAMADVMAEGDELVETAMANHVCCIAPYVLQFPQQVHQRHRVGPVKSLEQFTTVQVGDGATGAEEQGLR